MSGLARALIVAILLAAPACRYDSGWDPGDAVADASGPPAGRMVVDEAPPDGAAPVAAGMSCDLFSPHCPAGQACYRYTCAAEGPGAPGAHCNRDTDCASGALCQTSTATCRSVCKDADLDDCGEWCCPQHCLPVNDVKVPQLGYCIP